MRAVVTGAARTTEEFGRAFPGVVTRHSSGNSVLSTVPDGPSLVVCTPGAEPPAPEGYGAALLLDGWALLARPDLRAAEEALRRWMNAAALVAAEGTVVIGADAGLLPVQALIRWDPSGFARRELADRQHLGFPPATRLAAVLGDVTDVRHLLANAQLPAATDELGSAPVGGDGGNPGSQIRLLLRVPRPDGAALAEALHAAAAVRSAKRSGGLARIVLDPIEVF
jgi:primosomal protein N' (replication factor Y)